MGPVLHELTAQTLADQAYEALRKAIVEGELARGVKITERGLAAMLNVSVTPVREALKRLEQDRLVVRTGPRSVRVARLDPRDVLEVCLIESSLRALATRLAAERATQAQLDEIGDLLDSADRQRERLLSGELGSDDDWAELLTLLRRFHSKIEESSGSPQLLHMISQVQAFDTADRVRLLATQRRLRSAGPSKRYPEHRAIYDALVARDADLAEKLVLAHTRSAAEEFATTDTADAPKDR
ncbi:GntR family transcriptional regulator [Amycolatopsis thermoflava]